MPIPAPANEPNRDNSDRIIEIIEGLSLLIFMYQNHFHSSLVYMQPQLTRSPWRSIDFCVRYLFIQHVFNSPLTTVRDLKSLFPKNTQSKGVT